MKPRPTTSTNGTDSGHRRSVGWPVMRLFRSTKARWPALLAMAWMALVLGACGGEIVAAGPDVIAGPDTGGEDGPQPVDPLLGSYRLVAPGEASVEQRFDVSAQDVVGGPVSVVLESGPCEPVGDGVFVGFEEDRCTFTAVQQDSDTHRAGPPAVRDVLIRDGAPDTGSFTVSAVNSALVAERFSVDVSNVSGGPVDVAVTSGACRPVDPRPAVGSGDRQFWFVADEASICDFNASQADDDRIRGGSDQTVAVDVQQATGSFDLRAETTAEVGDPISVTVVDRIGGPVEVAVVAGDCQGRAGRYASRTESVCVFEGTQAETASHRPGRTRRIEVEVTRPIGSYEFEVAPRTVTAGEKIEVAVRRIRGGDVAYRLTSGPCRREFPVLSRASKVGDPAVFVAEKAGTCKWVADQADSPTHRGAEPIERIVLVTPAPIPVGSFVLSAPKATSFGRNFSVSVTKVVGGSVEYQLTSGPCVEGNRGVWIPTDDGTCVFRAEQADNSNLYSPAAPQVREVVINPLQGRFAISTPTLVQRGLNFSVEPSSTVGGTVTASLLSGGCKPLGQNTFTAVELGPCRFNLTQTPDPGYRAAAARTWDVEVVFIR